MAQWKCWMMNMDASGRPWFHTGRTYQQWNPTEHRCEAQPQIRALPPGSRQTGERQHAEETEAQNR
jgi:hypothetical protein